MHMCTPQHKTRVHWSHVYVFHLLMVLLEREDIGYRIEGHLSILSHFPLPADSCTGRYHHLHVVLVFTALLQRGNGI